MKKQLFLTLFLMFLVVVGAMVLLAKNGNLLERDYTETQDFYNLKEEYINGLIQYVLNPFDLKYAEEQLTVSDEEIDYYRHYYGTKEAQIDNVKAQYETREQTEAILAERDAKIAEIEKNFSSDEVVRQKILDVKKKALKAYKENMEKEKRNFFTIYDYFSYNLTEIGGEGDVKQGKVSSPLYSNKFTPTNPLNASSVFDIPIEELVGGHASIGLTESILIIEQPTKQFVGEILISKENSSARDIADGIKHHQLYFYVVLAIIIIAGIALLLLLAMRPKLSNFFGVLEGTENFFNKKPIDMRLAIVFGFGFLMIFELDQIPYIVDNIIYLITDEYVQIGSTVVSIVMRLGYSFVIFSGLVLTGIWTAVSLKNDSEQFNQSILYRIGMALREAFLNRTIGVQMTLLLMIMCGTAFTLGLSFIDEIFVIAFLLLVAFAFIPAFYKFVRQFGYLNRILMQTKDMAEGRTVTPIQVKGKSPLAEHARNLNALREGIETSIREQAKSERLKTELITNVSHDLRTPLTSIITYTDLLKNPDLSPEEREKYVNIVDQKSARLKTLIEDLFEVSKMASGNIEIEKSKVDLALMLQQIAAEHEEDYAKQGLNLRVTIEDQPIFALADGQKWWRVYDNLLVNARKYSLPNTRVYITLKKIGEQAVFTIKNIASYELNESAEELVERFKRADESRHTEGSGLGLAIAQSIVDLHGGQLKIEVDGDLFKVTVVLPL